MGKVCGGLTSRAGAVICPAFRRGHATAGRDEFRDMRSPYQFRGPEEPTESGGVSDTGFVPVVVHPFVCTCASVSAIVAQNSWRQVTAIIA